MGVPAAIAKTLNTFIGPGLILLYPLYASVRAIESPSMVDDQQWLTYWIIYSFITLFELSFWKVLAWFPFWAYIKLVFCMWLVLPMFNGAAYIYETMLRKYVKIGITSITGDNISSNYTDEQRKVLQMMSLDARKSVVDYVNKYGWDAVDRAIKAAERETKKH
ncbi:HVA22-like protein f [Linum grandiflorum]